MILTDNELDEITERIFDFHHKRAPGIPIGVAMVDLALEKLGPVKDKINAVCETQACLSDVLQIMVGCTVGNRYLRIYKWLGKYSLSLYDRSDGRGVRVFVNIDKIDKNVAPETYKFFHRTRSEEVKKGGPARIASSKKIIGEFSKIKNDILEYQMIQIKDYSKPHMLPANVCSSCGETFLAKSDSEKLCQICSGDFSYYKEIS